MLRPLSPVAYLALAESSDARTGAAARWAWRPTGDGEHQ